MAKSSTSYKTGQSGNPGGRRRKTDEERPADDRGPPDVDHEAQGVVGGPARVGARAEAPVQELLAGLGVFRERAPVAVALVQSDELRLRRLLVVLEEGVLFRD